jgi:hypothetical protein
MQPNKVGIPMQPNSYFKMLSNDVLEAILIPMVNEIQSAEEAAEYELREITDYFIDGQDVLFEVKWVDDSVTWEPMINLMRNAREEIDTFMRAHFYGLCFIYGDDASVDFRKIKKLYNYYLGTDPEIPIVIS